MVDVGMLTAQVRADALCSLELNHVGPEQQLSAQEKTENILSSEHTTGFVTPPGGHLATLPVRGRPWPVQHS